MTSDDRKLLAFLAGIGERPDEPPMLADAVKCIASVLLEIAPSVEEERSRREVADALDSLGKAGR